MLLTSALWADDSDLTLKRAVQPILLMIAALGAAKHWRPRQLCQFAAIFSGATLLVGIAAVVAHGSFGQGEGYRFGGTLHPNGQAVNCAALCLASLALFTDRRQSGQLQWRWLPVFLVGALFLLLTRSRTTTAAFGVGVLVYLCIGSSLARKFFIATAVVTAGVCGVFLLLLVDSGEGQLLTSAVTMGRQSEDTASLTGRLPIWESVLGDIASRPLLGYGYGAFLDAATRLGILVDPSLGIQPRPFRVSRIDLEYRRDGLASGTFHNFVDSFGGDAKVFGNQGYRIPLRYRDDRRGHGPRIARLELRHDRFCTFVDHDVHLNTRASWAGRD